jgi:hypothetical protein
MPLKVLEISKSVVTEIVNPLAKFKVVTLKVVLEGELPSQDVNVAAGGEMVRVGTGANIVKGVIGLSLIITNPDKRESVINHGPKFELTPCWTIVKLEGIIIPDDKVDADTLCNETKEINNKKTTRFILNRFLQNYDFI